MQNIAGNSSQARFWPQILGKFEPGSILAANSSLAAFSLARYLLCLEERKVERGSMQILETITDQITGNRLPLVAVTVAAVPCPDTPFILTMHWHGFVRERQVDADASETVTLTPVPSR